MTSTHTPSRVSKLYARSLFQLVPGEEKEEVLSALNELVSVTRTTPELLQAFANPLVGEPERLAVAGDLAEMLSDSHQLSARAELRNFLLVVTENDRFAALPEIAEAYRQEFYRYRDTLLFEVVSAAEVSEEEKTRIENILREESAGLAQVSWSVDPELIGGLLIRSGDRTLDGTVRGGLRQAREQLLR